MGKRAWLNKDLESRWLPSLVELEDTPDGHKKAEELCAEIRSGWSDRGAKTLQQQQSLIDQTRAAIKQNLGSNHFSLNWIKFTTEEYAELNDQKQSKVAERNTQCVILDPGNVNALLTRAVNLLQSPEWAEVAAALAVLTGRRSTEILATAEFTPKTEYSVIFTGALKRRGEEKELSFEIPTLCQADYVLKGLKKLRELVQVEGKSRQAINAEFGQRVIAACDRHFADLIPTRPDKDNLYSHLFRAVYATVATWFYCPVNVDATEFKAHCQGHFAVLDEKNPDLRRQLASSRHYSDFKIGDGKGNIDGRQGIRLDWQGVKVLEVFESANQAPVPQITERKHRSSLRIWREDHDQLTQVLSQFEGKTQQDKVGKWIRWTLEQLQKLNPTAPVEPTPETIETAPLPPAAIETVEPEPAQQEEPELLPTPAPAPGLETKIDSLVSAIAQLVQIQTQALTAPTPTATSASATRRKATATAPAPAETEGEGLPERKYRPRGQNQELVDKAINAIFAYNDSAPTHDSKWAVTINALKAWVGSQYAITEGLKARAEEISQHHAKHQIDEPAKHNLRHRGKTAIDQVIHLD